VEIQRLKQRLPCSTLEQIRKQLGLPTTTSERSKKPKFLQIVSDAGLQVRAREQNQTQAFMQLWKNHIRPFS
jgi:hypothetical protein